VEKLEDRTLLSGQVMVHLAGGDLVIRGDRHANDIEVRNEGDEIVVEGYDGTLINGSDQYRVDSSQVWDDVRISMRNGEDIVVVSDLEVPDHLLINSGRKDDKIVVMNSHVGGMTINTGRGDDSLLVRDTQVYGDNYQSESQYDESHHGGDDYRWHNRGWRDYGGAHYRKSHRGATHISTGRGDDRVGLFGLETDKISVKLDGGDDELWAEGTTVYKFAYVDGGRGYDGATEHLGENNELLGKAKARHFEYELPLVADVHWGYEGDIGPEYWGDLTPAFLLAEVGHHQSPIDIDTSDVTEADLGDIAFDYHDETDLRFFNNGHTVEVEMHSGNSIMLDGVTYDLLQLHFHFPSEHAVDGELADGEMHLVHADADGNLLVIGVLINEGASNSAFDQLVANLPPQSDPEMEIAGPLNAEDLLPADRHYYTYDGSLTTPPASEGVTWVVLTTPIELSASQIADFEAAIGGANNRPTQKLHGREVFEDASWLPLV
jgi:carbonic anhydrase